MYTHVHVHILEIMSLHQYTSNTIHPAELIFSSPIPYLYVPTSTARALASNSNDTCTYLLSLFLHLK